MKLTYNMFPLCLVFFSWKEGMELQFSTGVGQIYFWKYCMIKNEQCYFYECSTWETDARQL